MKNKTSIGLLVIILTVSLSFHVGSTAIDTGSYYLDNPLPIASYYVGKFSNGTYYAINGSNWKCFLRSSDADYVINTCLGNCTDESTGRERVVLRGDFTIDDTIQVGSYDELDMTQAEINLANGADCDMINISTTNNNRGGAYVHGGRLIGSAGTGNGIYIWKGANTILEDIDIENVSKNGVELDAVWPPPPENWAGFHNIRNVHVWFAGNDGFHVDAQVDNYFYRCIAQECGRDGFYLYGTNMLLECHPVNNSRYNFYVPEDGSANQFIDCYGNIAGRSCWRIEANGSRLVNPHADYASQNATRTYDAIYISGWYVEIIGGYVRGDGGGSQAQWGIYLSASSRYCTISGIRCENAYTGQITNLGSNNSIAAWNGTEWYSNWHL